MIDVHVALSGREPPEYTKALFESLKDEPITLHKTSPILGDVAKVRLDGMQLGTNEWVGWVDPDDLLIPGAYSKLLNAAGDSNFVWMNEYEWTVTADLKKTVASRTLTQPHHIHIIRRNAWSLEFMEKCFVNDKMDQYKKMLYTMAETGVHVDEVGYIWRNYSTSMAKMVQLGRWHDKFNWR